MRKKIEFGDNSEGTAPDPLAKTEKSESGFRNLVFQEKFWEKQLKFVKETTWLRFLPTVKPSPYGWMMTLDVYRDKGGVTFVSPATFDRNARDPFRVASQWLRKNKPELLGNKDTNPGGFKPYPSQYGVAWCVDTEAVEGSRLRLFYASLYDGSRGGTKGLGCNLKSLSEEKDNEPGSETNGQLVHGDITAEEAGKLVKVVKTKSEKSEFPSYAPGIGKADAPLDPIIRGLTDAEHELVCPLESVIYIPTEDEVIGFVRGYIGEDLTKQIFG